MYSFIVIITSTNKYRTHKSSNSFRISLIERGEGGETDRQTETERQRETETERNRATKRELELENFNTQG